ncbi:MAG: PH domain-containing protein [Oscillospiraceae bacterium]|nr:PH domain-containing protein [Oscillospiraceae bacterium]
MKKQRRNLYKKAHFYTWLNYSSHFIPLLVLPLLQNLLFNPTSIAAIITNYGLSIICVIMLFTAITMEYKSILYMEKENSVYAKKGVFFKKRADIPYDCIQSVYIQKNFVPRLMGGARRYIINTPGNYTANGDYAIFLRKRNAVALTESIFEKNENEIKYHGGFLKIILMAATWSNALTGLLILAPLLYNTSNILSVYLREYFLKSMDLVNYIVKIGVPPAFSGLAAILIVCWGIAYFAQLIRYSFFKAEISGSVINIKRGFLNRSEFITTKEKINAIQIRQSILMLVLNLKSVFIQTIGGGVQKGDKSLLIPADREEKINQILGEITTLPKKENYKIKPKKTEFMAYLWFPFYSILGTIGTMAVLEYFGYFGEIVRIPLIVTLLIFIYWLFFRMYSYSKSSITICDRAVRIDYFDKLNITRTYIPYDRIQYVKVYQSPWQRLYKTAHIKIYIYSNKTKHYKIKYLKYNKVMEAVDIIETRMKYRS